MIRRALNHFVSTGKPIVDIRYDDVDLLCTNQAASIRHAYGMLKTVLESIEDEFWRVRVRTTNYGNTFTVYAGRIPEPGSASEADAKADAKADADGKPRALLMSPRARRRAGGKGLRRYDAFRESKYDAHRKRKIEALRSRGAVPDTRKRYDDARVLYLYTELAQQLVQLKKANLEFVDSDLTDQELLETGLVLRHAILLILSKERGFRFRLDIEQRRMFIEGDVGHADAPFPSSVRENDMPTEGEEKEDQDGNPLPAASKQANNPTCSLAPM